MTPKQLDTARVMLMRGRSVASVAAHFKMTTDAMYREMADHGMSVRDLRAMRREEIKKDLAAGTADDVVRKRFGVSQAYLKDVKREGAETQEQP